MRMVHFEILAKDPQAVAQFYQDALGWEIRSWPGGEQSYWLVTTGPEDQPGINGGVMGQHFPQAVINTIEVPVLAPVLAQIEAAGGTVIHGPNEVADVGLHAYCTDPEGIIFGVMEPIPST